ncbi:C2 and GRAM domain-containing protein At5g50170 [Impatiens glandulifera]|uniref:C2 and GRAM domain-containing protein At5g50170 n=1 Tax=Impatiens glandulifera TaxID=253017 RepID=UPI001FB19344|nr:C2 and GRAM domain-containing protein At5g50170 [Impatiens glandulifera]
MKLYVYLMEGRHLPLKSLYVKLQAGNLKSKTRTLNGTNNPIWNEEFAFLINGIEDELHISVYQCNEDSGIFTVSKSLIGRVRVPVCLISSEDSQNLPPTWFSLETAKGLKFKRGNPSSASILLAISLRANGEDDQTHQTHPHHRTSPLRKMKAIAGKLERFFSKNGNPKPDDCSDQSLKSSDFEDGLEEQTSSCCDFEEAIEKMQSNSCNEVEMPDDLQGGILLDQIYIISAKDLNNILFAPNSSFRKDLAELQGTTDLHDGPWTWKSGSKPCLSRVVSYTNPASKLVKAVKATEEQTYLYADTSKFAVHVDVYTPDVPYGNTFKLEILYKITSEPHGDESLSRLVISWGINFIHHTMMKGMIEGGARQGLKESFDQFAKFLAQNVKQGDSMDTLNKDDMLETLKTEHKSDWEQVTQYFCNFTVISTCFMLLYVLAHILVGKLWKNEGLEFNGLDLPDNFGELITSGILIIHLERLYNMISHFVQARLQRTSDHGIKGQGDGWLLTVALIEGENIALDNSKEIPDSYVVLTCNGRLKTSSVKLQSSDPQWNEILEFDAMEEPPSTLDVQVFSFDGLFDHSNVIGHTEINFLKHTSAELADIWVPLVGKIAQTSQSKLHLRIFLDNTNGYDTIKEYLTKMEKEVGKKLNTRSPRRNSTFLKIFGLPQEEFLINHFSCSLKRKVPLQGRIFLSARIIGFYANFFGRKTKFFFLWEDIFDIQVLPPSLSSMGSPQLVIVLEKDRGLDASHGAKSHDEEGRLQFYFMSFVSFHEASRTIMALWRTKSVVSHPKEQAVDKEEEDDEDMSLASIDDCGPCLAVEDTSMSKLESSTVAANISSLMEMYNGGQLEHVVMKKCGCIGYVTSDWETVKPDLLERRLLYRLNRQFSIFGGEVTCTQQKTQIPNSKGWIVNEFMTLHDIPFSDHFRVHFKYRIVETTDESCRCDVYASVSWIKSTRLQQTITRSIIDKFDRRFREIVELIQSGSVVLSQELTNV